MSENINKIEGLIIPMLQTLLVKYSIVYLTKQPESVQFVIEDYGTIINGIDGIDYSYVNGKVDKSFPGYRKIFVDIEDDQLEKKEEIIWALMSGGYMRWLRFTFQRQFNNLIVMENFGNKIIDERLKRWNDKPMYIAYIDDNKEAKVNAASYILSIDPGFFDYMPENI